MQNEKGQELDIHKKVRDVCINGFITSKSFKNHPMLNVKMKLRARYYSALALIIKYIQTHGLHNIVVCL